MAMPRPKGKATKIAKKIMKHLGHDIQESKESMSEDKALIKKVAKSKKHRSKGY